MKSLSFDRKATRGRAKRFVACAALAASVAAPPSAMAALTDIGNAPISSSAATSVPPNVLFVLDASGSMNSEYLPDDMASYDGKTSFANPLCNTIYYNPTITYTVPKNADTTDFAASTFTSARNDGYLTSGTTGDRIGLSSGGSTNLNTSFKGVNITGSERAFYYKWTGAAAPTSADCRASAPSAARTAGHTVGNWTKVTISAAEEQNFANWFTYYRTRILFMKTAAGRAFNGLNDTFRVGFVTICPDGSSCSNDTDIISVTAARYLKIDAFASTHKSNWYSKFYSQTPGGFTPLRQALARAGRHFAGKTDGINAGMADDPIQYSCQQNFAILTTDGYWNYGRGKTLTNGASGTGNIGAQDQNSGLTPRPMYDGGPVTNVVTTTTIQNRFVTRTGSPSCSSPTSVRAQRINESVVTTTTTLQFGSPTVTGPTATTISSANVCLANGTSLPFTTVVSTSTTNVNNDTGGTANTLADVAEYYYRTDLRGPGSIGALGTDVGTVDNVPPSGSGVEDDKATWQHMTTFTLGLGLSGNFAFDPNYKNATTGVYPDIRAGKLGWPSPNPGTPDDNSISAQEKLARIDDLWHAAVNGRGQYFSAKDPVALGLALTTALTAIQARVASSAAAATSTLEPTTTDNLVIVPTYTTSEWTGELSALQIDLTTGSPTYGEVLPIVVWSAQDNLDLKTKAACDNRTIKLFHAGAANNLVDFTWNSQACDGSGNPTGSPSTGIDSTEQAFFTAAGAVDEVLDLSQYSLMTDGSSGTIDQKTAARGANLVNFLRGQRGKEGFAPNTNLLYRTRKHVLGDIVNSQPVYVRGALFTYSDPGYAAFAAALSDPTTGRAPMVYAAANDGMVHAITGTNSASGGDESWAFIPRSVLPRLYKLADNNYANLHEYYVDGRPVVADVFDSATSRWRTILVGGLNKGGRGYYALDITDPATPKALWEFAYSTSCYSAGVTEYSDCHLGLTFGNPVVSKLADGRWVVFVTSGYNNVSTPPITGDGQGYLYVLDAMTGRILYKIGTGVGDATTPSGLAKITAWVDNPETNNTTLRVYGVDLLGNVWRFDVNDDPALTPAGREATRLVTLRDPSGNPQPITIAPRLSEVGSPPSPFLYVGTGRYLGPSDVSDTQVQSVYAFKDPLTATAYTDLRTVLKQLTLTAVGTDRSVNCNTTSPTANCSSTTGWMVDFTEPGERVNVPMELQLGTLVVASNVPANTACEPGGFSFLNFFDFATGFPPSATTDPRTGYRLSGLTVGLSIVKLPDGSVHVYRQRADPVAPTVGTGAGMCPPGAKCAATPSEEPVPINPGSPSGKRSTWRELTQ